MGKKYSEIPEDLQKFMEEQHVFFIATASEGSRISLSPKGLSKETFKIVNKNKIIWLSLTGAGNETSMNIQDDGRMTVMFCSFDPKTVLILRLFGKAKVHHRSSTEWETLIKNFSYTVGARQIFEMDVDLVSRSCGFGVPVMEFKNDRQKIKEWSEKTDIEKYWTDNCQISIDGKPTNILKLNNVQAPLRKLISEKEKYL